jgi:hypothetical protein
VTAGTLLKKIISRTKHARKDEIQMNTSTRLAAAFTLGITLCSSACSDEQDKPAPDTAADGGEVAGKKPALMLSVATFNPEGRQIYVGAFPELPEGNVGTDNMVEFGDAYVYTYDGAIFVWEREALQITRFDVDDDYKLIRGGSVSFMEFGLQLSADHVFASPTRAYVMLATENRMVVWNPTTMEIESSFELEFPDRKGFDTYAAPLGVSGDRVYWALLTTNFDALEVYPKNVIAFTDARKDGPVTFVEDDRCVPSLGGYIVSSGDIYLVGGADADAVANYNTDANYPGSCVVRVPAGSDEFDPDYMIDLWKAANTPSISGTWLIDDDNVLLRAWDSEVPLPATYDDYWAGTDFVSKRLELESGEVSDFPALERGGFSSNVQYRVDNATYFSLPNADKSADEVYRLGKDGIENVFSIPGGGFWGFGRLR